MTAITLESQAPACHFGDELARWFDKGAELAAAGLDCCDLDLFVHDRRAVPDFKAATTVLSGYYAQKRTTIDRTAF